MFLDTAYERASDDFFERNIRPSLERSRYLIVIATPDALLAKPDGTANWVDREVENFMRERRARDIVVVRARGEELVGKLPGHIHDRFPNIEVVDLRAVSQWAGLGCLRISHLRQELLKIVVPLYDIAAAEVPALRDEERKRTRRVLGACWIMLLSVALIGAGVLVWRVQDRNVRTVSRGVPVTWCAAERDGSAVQRFEHGVLIARFSNHMFYAVRQRPEGTLEWFSFPDPNAGGRRSPCPDERTDRLLDLGFREAVCASEHGPRLTQMLGAPVAHEGKVLVQFQDWSGGLLIVGIPATAVGFARTRDDGQTAFAALDTMFLNENTSAGPGDGKWARINGQRGGVAYCTPIWYRSPNADWAKMNFPEECSETRSEQHYLQQRVTCDLAR